MSWSATVEWVFNSTDLTQTGKFRATTLSGYLDSVPLRGENIVIAFVTGRTFVTKCKDQQVIQLKIAVYGTSKTDFEINSATLRALVDAAQHTLIHNKPDGTQEQNLTAEARNYVVKQEGNNGMATIDFYLSTPGFTAV